MLTSTHTKYINTSNLLAVVIHSNLIFKITIGLLAFILSFSLSLQAIYVYQKAAIISMMSEDEVKKTGEDVVELFKSV